MPKLAIDGKAVEIPDGGSILDAARKLEIRIPTLCFREGHPPLTTCMLCLVKVNGRMVPACATKGVEGMEVQSDGAEVYAVRRAGLELLLSDHVGDCFAPCHSICPAEVNIPEILRHVEANRFDQAIAVLRSTHPLPATIERLCSAPCQKSCRLAASDQGIKIQYVNRDVADEDLASADPYKPPLDPDTGCAVAILGAGPVGLSAAYFLRQAGHACVVFDRHAQAGGRIRDADEATLPRDILRRELAYLEALGIAFRLGVEVGSDVPIAELMDTHDVVLVATGEIDLVLEQRIAAPLGLAMGPKGLLADKHTGATAHPRVFAAGGVVGPCPMISRAVADGRKIARAIDRQWKTLGEAVEQKRFGVKLGKPHACEMRIFKTWADERPAVKPSAAEGFTKPEARAEGERCFHCDCRALETCMLRVYAEEYGADPKRFKNERRTFQRIDAHPDILYEPGKCIACGICVQICEERKEALGLTFIGRGFDVRVGAPFEESLKRGLTSAAEEVAQACPTGALAFKKTRGADAAGGCCLW